MNLPNSKEELEDNDGWDSLLSEEGNQNEEGSGSRELFR